MSHFSSMVLGFGVGENFSSLLNKFICLSFNGLDNRLIDLIINYLTLSSRFDWRLGIKYVDSRW